MQESRPQSLHKLINLLSEITANDFNEISTESSLEDDLGIIFEDDLKKIVVKINNTFDISLTNSDVLTELEESNSTVGELVKLIDDEIELG